ncbi:hypothetical protein CC78DRAFT_533456 [Lojkania enalia]|uniref:Uncharacterized protein n=1 Tax=Lojkania enalia TaxID=147567 RepID=A0A9P4N425_9PLEO|nr:hypothetical protein CC78DRAFT_533456 [Didymosphaeria enalia]
MKSILAPLFATVAAAADYYGEYLPSSSSSSSKIGYTTINPGHGKPPVTITQQHQEIPTYIPEHGYRSTTGSWSDYKWVSTIIKDYDSSSVTVTETTQKVTVYHTKTTVTHTETSMVYGAYSAPTGAYATGNYGKNATTTTKVWTELYEKFHEVPYCDLGPSALPGYAGSGLYKDWDEGKDTNYQPVEVSEFTGGKWKYYKEIYTYGPPKPAVTTYDAPGTYTVDAYDLTVKETSTAAAEAQCTAGAHEAVTYGGYTTEISKPTTITVPYGAYESKNGKTKTVVKYTTVTYTAPGTYTVIKPTITKYETATIILYPTTTIYEPGVYHHDKETVTITKPGEAYTCSLSHTKPTSSSAYPTSSEGDDKPYETSKSYETPKVTPTPYETPKPHNPYPTYGHFTNSSIVYPIPSTTPIDVYSTPYPTETPATPTETPYVPTGTADPTDSDPTETATATGPNMPDPSSDYEEPTEAYGKPEAGYIKRGGMLERRNADGPLKRGAKPGKRVILV